MSTTRFALAVLLTSCATTKPFVPTEPEVAPDVAALACATAGLKSEETLKLEGFTACERDSDCAEVSALVSGTCGVFVSTKAFEAKLDVFEAQTNACSQAVQVVPVCPALRAACIAGRCTGEALSELPDDCAESKKTLRVAANRANTCNEDADCTLLAGDIVGSVAFSNESRAAQDALSLACGMRAPVLYGMRQPPGLQAFCFEHRCSSDRDAQAAKFTTVVRSSSSFKEPEFDGPCFAKAFTEAFSLGDHRDGKHSFSIAVRLRVDASARLSQFQFLEPQGLTVAAKAALAARIHACPALQPARLKGTPVPVMLVYRFTFLQH